MFSRNSDKDAPRAPNAPQPAAAPARPILNAGNPSTTAPSGGVSVIGSDLTIVGSGLRIIAKQPLQVDGEIQGDVMGSRVTIGPSGKVTGLVNAEQVHINGAVSGTIKGVNVLLSSTAVVDGDIFHQSITLEQGAQFEGRSRRPSDQSELMPDLVAPNNSASQASASPAPAPAPVEVAAAGGTTKPS